MPDRGASDSPDDIPVDAGVLSRLRAEVADLRLQIREEVRTRRVVVVDEAGVSRIRLTAAKDGASQVALLDGDGFERIILDGRPDIGVLSVAGRSRSGHPMKVEVFALDPDDDEGTYIGVELVDQDNSTAGFSLYEGRRAQIRTDD